MCPGIPFNGILIYIQVKSMGGFMLSIPFLNGRREKPKDDATELPDWDILISDILKAFQQNDPNAAYELVSPWLETDEAPAEFLKLAGHSLAAVGRHPESLEQYEKYLSVHPNSVKGLLAAGLAAARSRRLRLATDFFNRALLAITGRARMLLEPLIKKDIFDALAIEDLVYEVESHPGDKDRVLALVLALGRAGHFKAVEKFMPVID